uniref:Uncharacterized protein n=1 Tax=Cacopsylla melanoneura TaxID=428564 RepID=A0A8D8PXI6_9HEMI
MRMNPLTVWLFVVQTTSSIMQMLDGQALRRIKEYSVEAHSSVPWKKDGNPFQTMEFYWVIQHIHNFHGSSDPNGPILMRKKFSSSTMLMRKLENQLWRDPWEF